jgi:hypothetical protein
VKVAGSHLAIVNRSPADVRFVPQADVSAPFVLAPRRPKSVRLLPVRAQVDTLAAALVALGVPPEVLHVGLGRIVRHVDQRRVAAGIIQAVSLMRPASRARFWPPLDQACRNLQ